MLSKLVKSTERCVMNALKPEKNHKVFLYNDIAKIIVETQGISRKQILNLK